MTDRASLVEHQRRLRIVAGYLDPEHPLYAEYVRDAAAALAGPSWQPNMGHGWAVEVRRLGEVVVCIEEHLLTGRNISEADADLIRGCAQHLLAFVGEAHDAR